MQLQSIIKIAYLSPLRFYREDAETACSLVADHEKTRPYLQRFNKTDKLYFQVLLLKENWTAISYDIIKDGNVIITKQGKIAGTYGTSYTVWEVRNEDDIIGTIDPGIYKIVVKVTLLDNTVVRYNSEYFEICSLDHPAENTVLIEYSHDGNDYDTAFYPVGTLQSRRFFQLRVPGGMPSSGFQPASKDTFYVDQHRDVVMLDSIPFNLYKFTFGTGSGLPNWMIDKLNRIFSCSYVELNGRQFVKNDGAKLEIARENGYANAGCSIEMVLPDNPYSITDGSGAQLGDYNIDYNEDYF